MNTPGYKQHISSQFNAELEDVRQRVLAMGGLVEQQIVEATRALTEADVALAEHVARNDYKVNQFEVLIDEECNRILARRQPTASDLRLIVAAIKTITDLERIGDEAVNIAERAEEAPPDASSVPHPHLRAMADHTQQMLRDALDAFVEADTDRAGSVRVRDDLVDELYGKVLAEMKAYMAEHADRIPEALGVINVAKYLERIADHATNIAEEVIFMVAGQDVRHEHTQRPPTAP